MAARPEGCEMKEFSYQWPAEKQKKWNERALMKYMRRYIFPYHPFYRERFAEAGVRSGDIRSAEDFQRLVPLTTKNDIKKDPVAFALQPAVPGRERLYDTAPLRKTDMARYAIEALKTPTQPGAPNRLKTFRARVEQAARREWFPIHFHASGGTTGEPTPSMYTHRDIFKVTPGIAAMANLCGIELDHRALNLFPAAPHLAFFQVVMSQFLLGGCVFHTCGGAVIPTERQIVLAEKGKFDYIAAIPSYLTYWLETAKKMKDAGAIKGIDTIKYAVVAGEPMVPAYRQRLKEQFDALGSDAKIIEGYGMTELKGAFYSCGEGSGIHLSAENYFWEVLDPETKLPVPEGSPGVLTFSHIDFRGTVLLRYYTGDLINGLAWDKCPNCGVTGPRLIVPMSRAVKDFSKIKGSRVSMLDLQTAIRNAPGVETFQVAITKENPDDPFSRDFVKVFVAPLPGADPADIERDIKKNVKLDCEITPNQVIFQSYEEIEERLFQRTGLKADWIVDERRLPTEG